MVRNSFSGIVVLRFLILNKHGTLSDEYKNKRIAKKVI